ncbi:uncharacterized protein G2W53_019144 [Senna tora]|uniref:Uncharacterized protein n=1 Tax=Senna tora TaxID=362788 RepID=A0A834TX78_9FABA|nr:uncharacterized protein G2W53_019144 [Senna tora]
MNQRSPSPQVLCLRQPTHLPSTLKCSVPSSANNEASLETLRRNTSRDQLVVGAFIICRLELELLCSIIDYVLKMNGSSCFRD